MENEQKNQKRGTMPIVIKKPEDDNNNLNPYGHLKQDIGFQFLNDTKIRPMACLKFFQRNASFNASKEWEKQRKTFFKNYQSQQTISLKPLKLSKKLTYQDVIDRRQSIREFKPIPMDFQKLSGAMALTFLKNKIINAGIPVEELAIPQKAILFQSM